MAEVRQGSEAQAFFVKLTACRPAGMVRRARARMLFVCWIAMGFRINGGAFAERARDALRRQRGDGDAVRKRTPYLTPRSAARPRVAIPEGASRTRCRATGRTTSTPGEVGVAFTVIFFIATGIFMLYEWGILGLFLQYFKYIRKHGACSRRHQQTTPHQTGHHHLHHHLLHGLDGWLFSRMVPVPGHIGESSAPRGSPTRARGRRSCG